METFTIDQLDEDEKQQMDEAVSLLLFKGKKLPALQIPPREFIEACYLQGYHDAMKKVSAFVGASFREMATEFEKLGERK